MIATTTSGKQAMNGKPATGLQRKKEWAALPDGRWHYPNPFKLKVYTVFFDWGDMDYPSMKLKTNEPQLWREVYEEVRGDMMEAGILKTKEEAAEDRRLQRERDLVKAAELVQKKGEATLAKEREEANKRAALVEPGKDNPVVHNSGMRTGTVMETALQTAEALKTKMQEASGSRLSDEGLKLRKLLLSYSLSELKTLSHKDFQKQKSQYSIEYALFSSNKRWVIEFLEGEAAKNKPKAEAPIVQSPDTVAPPASVPVVAQPERTKKGVNILGTVPIGNITPELRKEIKPILIAALKLLSQDKPDGYSFVTLDDPPEIEIRETIWY